MKLEHVKRNLNQVVQLVDRRTNDISIYRLVGCVLRKNDDGYYYGVELRDLKANSVMNAKLEDIQEIS